MPSARWQETPPADDFRRPVDDAAPRRARRRRWWLDPLFLVAVATIAAISGYYAWELTHRGRASGPARSLFAGMLKHVALIGVLLAAYWTLRLVRRRRRRNLPLSRRALRWLRDDAD